VGPRAGLDAMVKNFGGLLEKKLQYKFNFPPLAKLRRKSVQGRERARKFTG